MISPLPKMRQTMKLEDFSPPFTKIAPYYDRLMSFVNYPSWISYIEKILELNGVNEKEILDLACGTGTCLEIWVKKKYKVWGIDGSVEMLNVCREKFSPQLLEDGTVSLLFGDLRKFFLPKPVPIITCLYDSLNYLLTEKELLSCFESVYKNLTDNGIFIFDMNTVHALRDEWGNQTFERHDGSIHSIWSNSYDQNTRISCLRLTINIKENNRIITFKELHQERGYFLEEIKSLLASTGMKFFLYRHLTFNPASENDTRIMVVARKL